MKRVLLHDGLSAVDSGVLSLVPGKNLLNGQKAFQEEFGTATSLEQDLLSVSSAVFAADLAIKRGRREGFARHIELELRVVNYHAFESIRQRLQYALYVLSNDAWKITFVPTAGQPEKVHCPSNRGGDGAVLLFSGGLDSLAAAVQLANAGEPIQLVSHITGNRIVSNSQQQVFSYLESCYPRLFGRIACRVSARTHTEHPFPIDQDREETQRTRSFVFLSLAVLAARRRNIRRVVYIAENGQMAIHLPLTAARMGAFSTHTAHPEFVCEIKNVLSQLLGFDFEIDNPFLYKTKAEVVEGVCKHHPKAIEVSISCWKASRVVGEHSHCGFCVPCLIRRVSLEKHGLRLDEYSRDILVEDLSSLPTTDDGKRNLTELLEFVRQFDGSRTTQELVVTFPEVLNPPIDPDKAIDMYKRFAVEAKEVFGQYTSIQRVM